ncbi:MAG: glycosyltransferase family 2 protein [Rickettsiales bacterium]
MKLSVVIPLYNEIESIGPLIAAVETALAAEDYELVLVDDGSADGTVEAAKKLLKPNWQLIVFQRNYGQTSAMAAGIAAARGEVIATMDGDLQNDPADIPLMVEKLITAKVDVVVGWRQKRQDGMLLRKIPSKIANKLIRKLSGVYVHDYGCTLKVFTQSTAKQLDLYGELHRFIPILASLSGAKILEMPVRHHARQYGVSKYGLSRTFRVISDLLLMFFFQKYRQKPMHLFGTLGVGSFGIGSLILGYLFILKLFGESIGTRPLFIVGILLLITGLQLITTGFIAELLMRTYFESQQKKPYVIKEHVGA